jgi:hypothetical protein
MQITISGIPEVTERMKETLLEGVTSGLERIGVVGQELVVREAPKATGHLASSIFPHLEQHAALLTEYITCGAPADVYGTPVNFGSRPHFPPYEDLIPWVELHFGGDEKTCRSIAFLIARKISRSGTDPNDFFGRAYQQLLSQCAGIMEETITEKLEEARFGR